MEDKIWDWRYGKMMLETAAFLNGGLFGLFGGVVRFGVMSLKATAVRDVSWKGLAIYGVIVILVGAFSGVMLNFGEGLSFLAGYAGLDMVEGYYKVFRKKIVIKGK